MITQNQQTKQKEIRLFNTIDLTKAIKAAKEAKPKESLKRVYNIHPKVSKHYREDEVTITSDTILALQPGSVKKFIDECHPDVKKFIIENHSASIKSTIDALIIVTRNGFTVRVSTTGINTRLVVITDKKKNILFNGLTTVTIKKEKVV